MSTINLNASYIGRRDDLIPHVPDDAKVVLDVGCSVGTLGCQVMEKNPGARVYGIELDKNMAKTAASRLHNITQGNMDEINLVDTYGKEFFDCIIFGDVLEHLKDPWSAIQNASEALKPGGTIITCIPNIRHIDTIYNLVVKGVWPYRDRGIHDRTHLRFFTSKNISDLFKDTPLKVENIVRKYRLIEGISKWNRFAYRVARLPFREFFVFQFIIIAKKPNQE